MSLCQRIMYQSIPEIMLIQHTALYHKLGRKRAEFVDDKQIHTLTYRH